MGRPKEKDFIKKEEIRANLNKVLEPFFGGIQPPLKNAQRNGLRNALLTLLVDEKKATVCAVIDYFLPPPASK